ncbi:S4 domain-containing protein, partial [Streptomyces rhizosphaericus]|uniref:S4 domain-containing protein n=1 Tax=Streptomyces rhizosphaericus TaxID=114699 RepID=UPI0023EA5E77
MTRPRRARLDAELVRRKLARSREHASQLIAAGRVTVGGAVATKPATQVETSAAVVVIEDDSDPDYVSRGGHKLAGALYAFSEEYRKGAGAGQDPGVL